MKFLSQAMRQTENKPFLLIALGRPEAREHLAEFAGASDVTHVALKPLNHRACEKMARDLAGDALDDDKLKRLIERCGGNPFYLQELVQHTLVAGSLELPESVLAMVSARLAELPEVERRLLRASSVFGSTFSTGALSVLLDESPASLRSALGGLVNARMLDIKRGAARDGDEYTFHHEYIREAAYGLLTDTDRRNAHAKVARWLTRLGERDPVRIGEHYRRADLFVEAIPWFYKAARQALAADDMDAVEKWAECAISCNASGEIRGNIRLLQAEACNWNAAHGRAYNLAEEALRLLPTGSGQWAQAHHMRLWSSSFSLHRNSATEVAHLLVKHLTYDCSALYLMALAHCVTILMALNEEQQAQTLLQALRVCNSPSAASPRVRATLAHMEACLADHIREHETAAEWSMRAIRYWEQVDNQRMALFEESNLAWTLSQLGQWEQAKDILVSGLELANQLQADYLRQAQKVHLLSTLVPLKQLAWARQLHSELFHHADPDDLSSNLGRAAFAIEGARLELVANDLDKAQAWLDTVKIAHLAPTLAVRAYITWARLLLCNSDTASALAKLELAGPVTHDNYGTTAERLCAIEVLYASGDQERGDELLGCSCAEIARLAALIRNPEWRLSFLHRVEENRDTIELARQRGLVVPEPLHL